MKNYYCKEIRSDGDECGETKEEKFYEGRKSACKYCLSKKIYQKKREKERDEEEEEEETVSNQEVLDRLGEEIEKKFKIYNDYYSKIEKRFRNLEKDIEEKDREIRELKKANNLYEDEIQSFRSGFRNIDRRLGYVEYKFQIRGDDPRKKEFEKFKVFEDLQK